MGRLPQKRARSEQALAGGPGVDDFAEKARVHRFKRLQKYPHLLHAFTLRAPPPRPDREFNFRPDGGPGREHAGENRLLLAARLGIPLDNTVWLDPDGEGPIRWVSEAERGKGARDWANRLTSASGMATDSLDVFLCTLFSDDAVVLLYDPRWHTVGMAIIRAMRPSPQAVLEATRLMAERVGSRAEDLVGLISPCIGPCCHRLPEKLLDRGVSVTNLWDFARMAMLNAGMLRGHITNCRLCTGCMDTNFFSRKIEGSGAAGAIVVGIRGDSMLEAVRAAQRAQRAQSPESGTNAAPPSPVNAPSLTDEEHRLNKTMRCPYGHNKVYIRFLLTGESTEASKPVLALRCDIMAHVGLAAAGYNIVLVEYIERFCCGGYERCAAYQEFSKRRHI